MPRTYDVVVLGATPAGLAAAHHLARKRRDVIVLDAPRRPAECPLADWVPAGLFRLKSFPSGLARACAAEAFRHVRYHNADLSRSSEFTSRTATGYAVDSQALTKALQAAARKAGATVRKVRRRPAIRLQEDTVQLVGARVIRARLLVLAQDHPDEALRELSLPARAGARPPVVAAGLDVSLGRRTTAPLRGSLHVVESPERTELGMFFVVGSVLHLRIVSTSAASGTRAAELSQMVQRLQEGGLVPENLPLGRAKGAVWYPPAGVALELETHVAKRCLLAGTAGGFADTITGHTLFPSIRSAILAADVAMAALASANVQETLMGYKTAWRESLADYLRPPNTSLQMLLPLLFVNQRVVPRFTRALVAGDSI